jgi:hypothetical protein
MTWLAGLNRFSGLFVLLLKPLEELAMLLFPTPVTLVALLLDPIEPTRGTTRVLAEKIGRVACLPRSGIATSHPQADQATEHYRRGRCPCRCTHE